MAEQLIFDLPRKVARGRSDFFISPSNAYALETVENWRDWPEGKLILTGPRASGKSHLAAIWASESGAATRSAADLAASDLAGLGDGNLVIEDASIPLSPEAEETIFHLHNRILSNGHRLLITAERAPGFWPTQLPDLKSRMMATQLAVLEPPDDGLLCAVLVKHFSDRQLVPPAALITYIAQRMDRSLLAADEIVAAIDAAALRQKRALSQRFVADILDKHSANDA